jgi:hypothetical protein
MEVLWLQGGELPLLHPKWHSLRWWISLAGLGCVVDAVEMELEDALDLIAFLSFVSESSMQMSRTWLFFLFL